MDGGAGKEWELLLNMATKECASLFFFFFFSF